MPKKEQDTFEKIQKYMFEPDEKAALYLTDKELEMKHRCMAVYSLMLQNPLISDNEIRTFLMNGCQGPMRPVSEVQANRYLYAVKSMMGNIRMSAKVWYQHMVVEGCKEAYAIALSSRDVIGMIAALDKIGKYMKLDKEELDPIDYEKVIAPSFEPVADVSILGNIKTIENLDDYRRKLRARFKKLTTEVATEIDSE